MRYTAILLLIAELVLAVSAWAGARKTVVDYFNMTVSAENAIINREGKWLIGIKNGGTAPVSIVDINNGYIRIEKEGEGWLEAALFLKKDGSPILVMSMKMMKGSPCSVEDAVQVFELKNGVMTETASLLPILPMDPFFKEGFDFSDKRKIGDLANTVRISYRLPRKGVTIQATLDRGCFEWTTGRGSRSAADTDGVDERHINNFLEGIKCKVIDIKWDMGNGRFTVDDACR